MALNLLNLLFGWLHVLDMVAVGSIEINSEDDIYSTPRPIYLSSDNGEEWETLDYTELSATHIFIDSKNNIFIGFWGGIYKSSNNGASWELVLTLGYMVETVNSIVENSEGILFAGTINFIGYGGIYYSTDQGDYWEHLALG